MEDKIKKESLCESGAFLNYSTRTFLQNKSLNIFLVSIVSIIPKIIGLFFYGSETSFILVDCCFVFRVISLGSSAIK